MIRSFNTYEEALDYWRTKVPRKACDFVLEIVDPLRSNALTVVPILDWSMPEAGLKYESVDGLPFTTAKVVEPTSIELKFVALREADETDYDKASKKGEDIIGENVLFSLWSKQFNTTGTPVFIPYLKRPEISIKRLAKSESGQITGSSVAAVRMLGCSFTYPEPSNMSQSSVEVCQYKMTVSYCDIILQNTQ